MDLEVLERSSRRLEGFMFSTPGTHQVHYEHCKEMITIQWTNTILCENMPEIGKPWIDGDLPVGHPIVSPARTPL